MSFPASLPSTQGIDGHALVEFIDAIAGFRPGTPDNVPVIGPTAIEGLILASGHYRNGILLAPVTARAVGDLVEHGTTTGIEAAHPARFQEQETR